MICSDGTALRRCQYSGTIPHTTKAAAVINSPRRASIGETALIRALAKATTSTPPLSI